MALNSDTPHHELKTAQLKIGKCCLQSISGIND